MSFQASPNQLNPILKSHSNQSKPAYQTCPKLYLSFTWHLSYKLLACATKPWILTLIKKGFNWRRDFIVWLSHSRIKQLFYMREINMNGIYSFFSFFFVRLIWQQMWSCCLTDDLSNWRNYQTILAKSFHLISINMPS